MRALKKINGKTYMAPKNPDILFGYDVIVVCEHCNGEQKRKHRKRRINKKWLKRYGVWEGQPLNKDEVIIYEGKLLVSRATYRQLKRAINLRSIDQSSMYLPCNPEFDRNNWIEKLKNFAKLSREKPLWNRRNQNGEVPYMQI